MSGLAWAIILALVVASGVPLGRWACRRDPGPFDRADADRALLRLARTGCDRPDQCPTCTALADRATTPKKAVK
ncbi:hypothetical protein [Streptomyces sp. NPDC029004]|uniref:hypothetical protein n=1 Tax=Streptomyces sp. NPDC029004 TaxID=3154490 RepID=UPI0033E484A9